MLGGNGYNISSIAGIYNSAFSANAYWFEFTDTSSHTTAWPDYRYFGFPVRCLV